MDSRTVADHPIEGSRVIYQGSDKEASINVVNRSGLETVMQSRVSIPDERDDAPFTTIKPLTLIPPNGQQMLRVLHAGQSLPEDRESLFWLNILDIPRNPRQADTRKFAIRQRLKLFYRPARLSQ
ncbi:molecular chaperone [Pseudomonas aeruginosa]|uniref:molecular chaperone n=1 Tax=Pseudomonas aeruginosa TaxID=287 RepID=UPI0021ADC3CC|nr:molecular chaperone [Pseudomonas aeruginosa]